MYLLDNRLGPITFVIGFLKSPLSVVADAAVAWMKSNGFTAEADSVDASLEDALRRLEPLTPGHDRILWLQTQSPWVAYFDNGFRGSDPGSPVAHLSRTLKCWGLIVWCVPHTYSRKLTDNRWLYGEVQFWLFRPEPRPGEILNFERTISAMYDVNGWTFEQSGAIQPYEEPERYRARKVVDRFTPEMLNRYCAALGIRLFDPAFYGPKGVLIDNSSRLARESPCLSLAAARYQLGLEP